MIDKDLKINERFDQMKTLLDISSENRNIEECTKKIKEAYGWLSFALTVKNPIINAYYNYAKACIYYALFANSDKVGVVDDNLKKEKLDEAKRYLDVVEILFKEENQPSGYLFTLRNYYEACGDYKMAIEINDKIGVGDSEKAKICYAEKLKPES